MTRALAPCPSSPNCVSSQSADPAKKITPLAFEGSAAEAVKAVVALLSETPRVRLVAVEPEYVHAEFTTLLFRFVDDVEFLVDPKEKILHFRSASRVGHSDLGANRRRMESLCRALEARGGLRRSRS